MIDQAVGQGVTIYFAIVPDRWRNERLRLLETEKPELAFGHTTAAQSYAD